MEKSEILFDIAQGIAAETLGFFDIKGPSVGDHATNRFMKRVREEAAQVFMHDYSEVLVVKDCTYRFDFHFPDEATVVEIALSLRNPLSEYEKDLFKCLLAQEAGLEVKRLVFITKPGGLRRVSAAGPAAIAEFISAKFGIDIQVRELPLA